MQSIYKFNRVQVTSKFALSLLWFLVLAILSHILIQNGIQKKEFDSVILNLAGKQRLYIQKYTSEVNMALVGLASSDWHKLLEYRDKSTKTQKEFENFHNILLNSGHVFIESKDTQIPAVKDPIIRKQLQAVFETWINLKREVVIAFRTDKTALKGNEHLQHIQEQSLLVINLMDQAVALLQRESEKRLEQVNNYVYLILIGLVLVFFIIFFYVYRRIILPLEDVTEAGFIMAEKAKRADIAKSAFLANMSHEIRTPLNAVMGISQLMMDSPLNNEQKSMLNTMNNSGNLLLTVVNDILDYSKIESDKLQLENTSFDMKEVIVDVINLMSSTAKKKHLQLEYQCDETPRQQMGDTVRIKQILTNLIGNAIKFTSKGKINIDLKVNKLTDKEITYTVSVADTGIGIEPEKLDLIFNKFSQADTSTTRKHGGTGLGLTISQKLIQLMGGNINVSSRPGEGSIFSFTLSLAISNKSKPKVVQKNINKQYPAVKVLLVEDDKVNRMIAKKMLMKSSCEIVFANNGQEAVEKVSNNSFDLVLMDIQMPIMNGIEATKQIRKTNSKIIIIALTANVMKEEQDLYIQAGMNDLIAKPIQMSKLHELFIKWL